MIITLVRQGGFTGIPLKKTVDTTKIDPEKAKEIENRIKNYALIIKDIDPQSFQKSNPDQFSYSLSIQDDEALTTQEFSETELPDDIKKIIHLLLTT